MELTIEKMFETKEGQGQKGPWKLYSFQSGGRYYKVFENAGNRAICEGFREGAVVEPSNIKEQEYNGKISYALSFGGNDTAGVTQGPSLSDVYQKICAVYDLIHKDNNPLG